MAALVAWIIGTITGARREEETTPAQPQSYPKKSHNSIINRQSKTRIRGVAEEPSFSTTLTTPIEEVIEESLNEESTSFDPQQYSSSSTTATTSQLRKRNKKSKKSQEKSESVEDNLGYSFFSTKQTKPEPFVKKQSKKQEIPESASTESVDSIGFSFIPVKDRKLRRNQNLKKESTELPKSAIIEHYKTKKPTRKVVKTQENHKVYEAAAVTCKNVTYEKIVNKETGRTVYVEAKESKKVNLNISYAAITSQKYDVSTKSKDEVKQEPKASPKQEIQIKESTEVKEETKTEKTAAILQEQGKEESSLPESDTTSGSTTPSSYEKIEIVNNSVQLQFNGELENELSTVNDEVENHNEKNQFGSIGSERREFEEINKLIKEDGLIKSNLSSKAQNIEGSIIPTELLEEFHNLQNSNIKVEPLKLDDSSKSDSRTLIPKSVQNWSASNHFSNIAEEVTKFLEEEIKNLHCETLFRIVKEEERVPEKTKEEIVKEITSKALDNFKEVEKELDEVVSTTKEDSKEIVQDLEEVEEASSKSEDELKGVLQELEEVVTKVEEFKMSPGQQIRVLTLNKNEHQDSTLYRIEKNWILQFRIGPNLMGRQIFLYCNYPKNGEEFDRHTYNLLHWKQDQGCNQSDDTSLLIDIKAEIAGSYHYYFTFTDDEKHQGSGFFLVDPILKYGLDEVLPLDCIQCQTVLTKSLGAFHTWEDKLRVGKKSGYNMIHFTPIQELGGSNSSYSLSEQLKVNPLFKKKDGTVATFDDIEKLITKLRREWKVTSICDIVLNHTANESTWLEEHPDATYNCSNCPYMRPAYLVDSALYKFSLDIANGMYEEKGIPPEVNCDDHLNSIRYHLHTEILSKLKIHELFICDVNKYTTQFLQLARHNVHQKTGNNYELELIQDPQFRRLNCTVDMDLALKLYNVYRSDCFDEDTRIKRCAEEFKNRLDFLNNQKVEIINNHLNAAVENCIKGIHYYRVQHDGPRIKAVTAKDPLVSRYFTDWGKPKDMEEYEEVMYGEKGKFLRAHNGWVMNADPLKNFAAPDSNVYIRRELIAWGDSVKLRYGDKPEDSPFLWEHMKAYVEQIAKIFDGVRLDNCHSTPMPVAEYLLDAARQIRPNLYVVAELFTNSDMTDNIFVNRLGITSLIREALNAWDSHEQGRLVYRFGGSPVGSFYQPNVRPLVPSIAHALFLDVTHDNPSPAEKRSVFDFLPSAALVNMACCASGSNRGYDELVPHHIHVVDETRQYTEWSDIINAENPRFVNETNGIIAAKRALNDLHYILGKEGFNQVYVDQMDPDIVAVTRHCPETHQSYILVAFTAFSHPSMNSAQEQRYIKPLRVEGKLDEIVLEASLTHINPETRFAKFEKFTKNSDWINGLDEYQVQIKEHLQPEESGIFDRVNSNDPNTIQLNFKNFKPGSVAIIKVSLPTDMKGAVDKVRKLISQFNIKKETELLKVVSALSLADLNRTLYRCAEEERDENYRFDVYDIPDYGRLVYAGLQGFISLLSKIRPQNDLGHPMCKNLRDGNWMIDYIWRRLKNDEGTRDLGQWLEENTKPLKSIPRYLIPCYFDVIVTGVYILLLEQSYKLMSEFVQNGSTFVKALSLGSLQFAAYIKSADLPTLSTKMQPPLPPYRKVADTDELKQACVTLSAGLPHFSIGYMRNWGRDTFIALRGLFLLTGRYDDARYHILGYAACLRHGLIPNLLDGGRCSRFNCRDAVWWWLYSIKCYTEQVPNGKNILKDIVTRIFPNDDSPPQPPGTFENPLYDLMQEALNTHFQGLVFRERNAGKSIDEHMTGLGFNNQIGVLPENGFVFGGNEWNCGTWMDKMGSSDKAGNRGKPATPRDGSAVEIIGLSKAVLSWLAKLNKQNLYPFDGVERTTRAGTKLQWTFDEWAEKIQMNFEKYFYVNEKPTEGELRPDLINKRGIYKDCVGASQEWTDYQLRCNFPIAMVVAPELFDPKHAWIALEQAEKYLLGPLGMKTLDPEDWAYRGYYDNSNNSDDFNVAHGYNYHQGPEWLWPVGFFLRAKLHFAALNGKLAETIAQTKITLSNHFVELQTSDWRGLPELTNEDGAYCQHSSRTQAWSMSSILEVLYDLQTIQKTLPTSN